MNVIDPALPASQILDRGSSTTNSSLVLTNARISARSTVVTDGPVALTCLAEQSKPDTPLARSAEPLVPIDSVKPYQRSASFARVAFSRVEMDAAVMPRS